MRAFEPFLPEGRSVSTAVAPSALWRMDPPWEPPQVAGAPIRITRWMVLLDAGGCLFAGGWWRFAQTRVVTACCGVPAGVRFGVGACPCRILSCVLHDVPFRGPLGWRVCPAQRTPPRGGWMFTCGAPRVVTSPSRRRLHRVGASGSIRVRPGPVTDAPHPTFGRCPRGVRLGRAATGVPDPHRPRRMVTRRGRPQDTSHRRPGISTSAPSTTS